GEARGAQHEWLQKRPVAARTERSASGATTASPPARYVDVRGLRARVNSDAVNVEVVPTASPKESTTVSSKRATKRPAATTGMLRRCAYLSTRNPRATKRITVSYRVASAAAAPRRAGAKKSIASADPSATPPSHT